MGVELLYKEVVEVVDFVGFVRVQGEHAVEYGIAGEDVGGNCGRGNGGGGNGGGGNGSGVCGRAC